MTSIAKTARVTLAVAIVALGTAGAASADAFRPATHHPDPGNVVELSHLAAASWSSVNRLVTHPNPGSVVELLHSTGSSWSSIGTGHITRFRPNGSGCWPRCML